MSKPANKRLIGIFVLGAIALLVIAIVVLGSGRFFTKTVKAVCFFEGSVGGLDVGAPVVFDGVRIGSVTNVILRYNTVDLTTTIPVYIELDPRRAQTIGPRPNPKNFERDLHVMIDRGLKARLQSQSLVTGKLQVTLGYYPDRPIRLVGADRKYPEIPTIPTTVQEITRRIEQLPIEEIVKNIATAVDGINRVVNSPEMTQTIKSVSRAAEESRGLIENANNQVQPLSSEIQQTLREARQLIRELEAKAAMLTSSVDGTAKDVQELVQRIQQTLATLEGSIGEDSELMYEIRKAVKELGTAGKAIQGLATSIERQPESLLFGKKKK